MINERGAVPATWRLNWVESTGSTNADVIAAARLGEPEGYVLVADHQAAGRGRLGRSWESPAGASLAVSVLLRPTTVPGRRWPWLPLLVGLAAVEAVRATTAVTPELKWPNDVLLGGVKLAGILVELTETPAGPAAVAGVGMNITAAPPGAVSLASAVTPPTPRPDRDGVLAALLGRLGNRYDNWRSDPASDELVNAYREVCGTIGREVRALLPGGATVSGLALDVDDAGRLVIDTGSGRRAVGAGDVVHLRAATRDD